jgi:hypothetical protein
MRFACLPLVLVIVIVVDLPVRRCVEKKGYCGLSLDIGLYDRKRLRREGRRSRALTDCRRAGAARKGKVRNRRGLDPNPGLCARARLAYSLRAALRVQVLTC